MVVVSRAHSFIIITFTFIISNTACVQEVRTVGQSYNFTFKHDSEEKKSKMNFKAVVRKALNNISFLSEVFYVYKVFKLQHIVKGQFYNHCSEDQRV